MRVTRSLIYVLFVALIVTPAVAGKFKARSGGATTIGKNPGKTKGRWLRVADAEGLRALNTAAIGKVSTDIHWKNPEKETPHRRATPPGQDSRAGAGRSPRGIRHRP